MRCVTRYVAAFGPVSVMDAQAWCGLTKLGEVFERLRPSLVTFRDEGGRELFDLPDAPRPDPDTPAPPRFLYDFENMLLSYADRSRVIAPDVVRGLERTQESLSTFTLDGFVAGTWGVERERGRATLTITPLASAVEGRRDRPRRRGRRPTGIPRADATDRDIRFAEPQNVTEPKPTSRLREVLHCGMRRCHNPGTMTSRTHAMHCSCRPSAMQGRWCT